MNENEATTSPSCCGSKQRNRAEAPVGIALERCATSFDAADRHPHRLGRYRRFISVPRD
jgi:hypothetical protein